MLNLSHTIRKFNRFELKYLITLQQAEQFKSALRAYMVPDEHGNNDGHYALTSLYFDSPSVRWRNLPAESSEDVLSSTLSVFSRLEQKIGIRRQ